MFFNNEQDVDESMKILKTKFDSFINQIFGENNILNENKDIMEYKKSMIKM